MGSPIAAPSEVPISDPGADGTYPILGDPPGSAVAGWGPARPPAAAVAVAGSSTT